MLFCVRIDRDFLGVAWSFCSHCSSRLSKVLCGRFRSLGSAMAAACPVGDAKDTYDRLKADPSIGVSDIEKCLDEYFEARN